MQLCHIIGLNNACWLFCVKSLSKPMLMGYDLEAIMGLLSWNPIFNSSDCNSFEDQAPVDLIYMCPSLNELQRFYNMTGNQGNNPSNGCWAPFY